MTDSPLPFKNGAWYKDSNGEIFWVRTVAVHPGGIAVHGFTYFKGDAAAAYAKECTELTTEESEKMAKEEFGAG